DADLLLSRAMALIGDWQIPRAYASAQRAGKLAASAAQSGAAQCVRGILERVMGRFDEGDANLQQSLPLLDPQPVWYALATYQIGLTSMMRADARGLVENHAPARALHARPDQVLTASLSQTYSAVAEWWRGNPEQAAAMAQEMFGWIDLTEELAGG